MARSVGSSVPNTERICSAVMTYWVVSGVGIPVQVTMQGVPVRSGRARASWVKA